MRYPKELKQKVLSRMMAPRNEAVSVLVREFKLTAATLDAWRRAALEDGVATPDDGRNAEEWRGSAKFAVMLGTAALLISRKKSGGDPGRGKGRMISTQDRCVAVTLIDEALESGVRLFRACAERPRTYRRWTVQKGAVKADGRRGERWPGLVNALSEEERQKLVAQSCQPGFASLPPSQIVPILADRGEYCASESSFYRVLKAHDLQRHRGPDIDILGARKLLYEAAKVAKPERRRGSIRNWERAASIWLNPVRQENKTVKLAA